jgi:hypothetical protein
MPRPSAMTADCANFGGAETCTTYQKTCTVSALQVAITDIIKSKKPAGTKAWAYLCDLFGIKERSAKSRLSNSVSYTIEELQALIQGEDGRDFLDALMADAEPEWWIWTKQIMAQAAKRRLAAEATQEALQLEAQLPPTAAARRLTKGNADVSKKLSSAFARKETALGFLRPDNNRSLDSGMAQAKARAR